MEDPVTPARACGCARGAPDGHGPAVPGRPPPRAAHGKAWARPRTDGEVASPSAPPLPAARPGPPGPSGPARRGAPAGRPRLAHHGAAPGAGPRRDAGPGPGRRPHHSRAADRGAPHHALRRRPGWASAAAGRTCLPDIPFPWAWATPPGHPRGRSWSGSRAGATGPPGAGRRRRAARRAFAPPLAAPGRDRAHLDAAHAAGRELLAAHFGEEALGLGPGGLPGPGPGRLGTWVRRAWTRPASPGTEPPSPPLLALLDAAWRAPMTSPFATPGCCCSWSRCIWAWRCASYRWGIPTSRPTGPGAGTWHCAPGRSSWPSWWWPRPAPKRRTIRRGRAPVVDFAVVLDGSSSMRALDRRRGGPLERRPAHPRRFIAGAPRTASPSSCSAPIP